MKKTILIIFTMLIGLGANAQEDEDKKEFASNAGKWEIAAAFGTIKYHNTETVNVKDNINVGLTFEATRRLNDTFYASGGVTVSTLKNLGELWENPLNYFSANANLGARLNTGGLTEGYVALGGSYISAANTIPNAKASFSTNITGGFIFWLRDSNYGLTMQNTYKIVNSDYMVSHNQFTLGVAYKL